MELYRRNSRMVRGPGLPLQKRVVADLWLRFMILEDGGVAHGVRSPALAGLTRL
jgi:hypothetical protein